MFNIAKNIGWETFRESLNVSWDSTFVDALGPRDAIEIKPKSNTENMSPFICQFFFLSNENFFHRFLSSYWSQFFFEFYVHLQEG